EVRHEPVRERENPILKRARELEQQQPRSNVATPDSRQSRAEAQTPVGVDRRQHRSSTAPQEAATGIVTATDGVSPDAGSSEPKANRAEPSRTGLPSVENPAPAQVPEAPPVVITSDPSPAL